MKNKNDMRIKRKIGALVVIGLFLIISIASPVSAVQTLGEGDTKVEVTDTGDGTIIWEEDGTRWMTLDAGKFGMGDTSSEAMLEIAETGTTPFMISNGASGDGDFLIMDTNGCLGIGDTDPDYKLEIAGSSGSGYFGVSSAAGNDGDIFVIGSGGNVGIGITTFSTKFHVLQTVAADAFRVDDMLGDTTPFVIDQDGNVGIGTTSPDTELHVNGDIKQKVTTSNVGNPPSDNQLDILFGTPASNGDGWTAYLKDSDTNNFYQIVAVGTGWYIFTATLAT